MELVSVIIPTKNSISTILSCLESVKNQTYSNIEIIAVDGNSNDGTRELCENYNARVYTSDWKLLGARYLGAQKSSGQYFLMMDSDQILEKTCIQNCIRMIQTGFDMLCLEEKSFEPRTFIQKMYQADRRLIHEQARDQLDPVQGAISPRFYRRAILEKVFALIPGDILPFASAWEDAIIYFEASRLTKKVAIVPNAIWHQDPRSLREVWYKNRGYGYSAHKLARMGHYSSLLSNKLRFRTSRALTKNTILSVVLLLLKAPAYLIGYYLDGIFIKHQNNDRRKNKKGPM